MFDYLINELKGRNGGARKILMEMHRVLKPGGYMLSEEGWSVMGTWSFFGRYTSIDLTRDLLFRGYKDLNTAEQKKYSVLLTYQKSK